MTLEQAMKLLGEGATKEQAQSLIDSVKAESQSLLDKETKGLKENKEKLLDQMAKLKKNQIPDGFDAEGYTKYIEDKEEFDIKQKELEDQKLADKGEWEALRLKLVEKHERDMNSLKEGSGSEISGLQRALDKELIENQAIKAIEKEKGSSLFLLPHMRNLMKTVKGENGEYSVQILDNKGNQRLMDDAVTPFKVEDLVAEFKANEQFERAFPTQNSGGGGNPNVPGGGGNIGNPWKKDTKNITEQAKLTRDNPTLAAQLKKAAGVA